ncbi:hypothetical protein ZIOFF_030107 [Zingiber officinale]|uniref:HVA22-like protein n=1 Tax=Zingiber officinale TaxID=94328 RepID=A0A8J5GXM8_ZINOF|nr:hypothetical protein ZIOFF_030107 [Zingiber officinale]
MMGSFLNRVLIFPSKKITTCRLVFGYAYPAYQCFKTVELNKPEIEQLRFWCQYWILVAVLAVFESFGDIFLFWLPMYSEGKLALYIFLWYPKLRGTNYVYDTFFKPYLTKYESEIDCNLHELRVRAADIMLMYWQKAAIYGRTSFFEVLNYVILMVQTSRTCVIQKTQQPQQPEQAQQSSPPSLPASHQEPQQDAKMPSIPIKQRVQEHPKRSSSVHHRASSPASPSHQATASPQTQQERKVSHSPVKKRIALKPVSPAQPQGSVHESDGTETRNKPPTPLEEAEDDSNLPADESHIDEAIHSARSRLRKRGSNAAAHAVSV